MELRCDSHHSEPLQRKIYLNLICKRLVRKLSWGHLWSARTWCWWQVKGVTNSHVLPPSLILNSWSVKVSHESYTVLHYYWFDLCFLLCIFTGYCDSLLWWRCRILHLSYAIRCQCIDSCIVCLSSQPTTLLRYVPNHGDLATYSIRVVQSFLNIPRVTFVLGYLTLLIQCWTEQSIQNCCKSCLFTYSWTA